jgi:hypothetical protein
MSENRVLRVILEPKSAEIIGNLRKLQVASTPYIIRKECQMHKACSMHVRGVHTGFGKKS